MAIGGRTFNGTNQYGSLGTTAAVELTTFSIAGWVKFTGTPLSAFTFMEALNGSYIGWRFQHKAGVSNAPSLYDGTAWRNSTTSILTNPDVWLHLGLRVTSGSSGKFYLNGAADGTFTPGTIGTAGGTEKTIMRDLDLQYAVGEISEWGLWNIALADADFAALYNGGSGGNGASPQAVQRPNLVDHWRFNEVGATITGQVGGLDITLYNSPGTSGTTPAVDDPPAPAGGQPMTKRGGAVSYMRGDSGIWVPRRF